MVSTQLKKYSSSWIISPRIGVKKNIWNHQPETISMVFHRTAWIWSFFRSCLEFGKKMMSFQRSLELLTFAMETLNGILVVVINLYYVIPSAWKAPDRFFFRRKHMFFLGTPQKKDEFFIGKIFHLTRKHAEKTSTTKSRGPGIPEASRNPLPPTWYSLNLWVPICLNMSGHPLAIHGNWFLFTYMNGWSYVGFYDKLVGEYTIPINPSS